MIEQVFRRLQLLFSVGKAVMTGRATMQAEFFSDGDPDSDDDLQPEVQHIQPYGYSYWPQPGAQVYAAFANGDRAIGFALITGDKRYQIALTQGEVAVHDDTGQSIHLTRGGIVVKGGGKPMLFTDTPKIILDSEVETTKNLITAQNITAGQEIQDQDGTYSMSGMRADYDSHTHPGDSGGLTGVPNQKMGGK